MRNATWSSSSRPPGKSCSSARRRATWRPWPNVGHHGSGAGCGSLTRGPCVNPPPPIITLTRSSGAPGSWWCACSGARRISLTFSKGSVICVRSQPRPGCFSSREPTARRRSWRISTISPRRFPTGCFRSSGRAVWRISSGRGLVWRACSWAARGRFPSRSGCRSSAGCAGRRTRAGRWRGSVFTGPGIRPVIWRWWTRWSPP